MYAETFIKQILKSNAVISKRKIGETAAKKPLFAYSVGEGKMHVLLLAGLHPKEHFPSEILGALLCHIAECAKHNVPICGIRLEGILKERTFIFVPSLPLFNRFNEEDLAAKSALQSLCRAENFRHIVLLSGEGPFLWRPPLGTEYWNAQMPMALKILADSVGYPLLPFAPPKESFEAWFAEQFHRPVFRFAPPRPTENTKAEKSELYFQLEEALLLASIL